MVYKCVTKWGASSDGNFDPRIGLCIDDDNR